jgi:hypothetical protein
LFISFFEGRMSSGWIVTNIPLAEPCITARLAFLAGVSSWSVDCTVYVCITAGDPFSQDRDCTGSRLWITVFTELWSPFILVRNRLLHSSSAKWLEHFASIETLAGRAQNKP